MERITRLTSTISNYCDSELFRAMKQLSAKEITIKDAKLINSKCGFLLSINKHLLSRVKKNRAVNLNEIEKLFTDVRDNKLSLPNARLKLKELRAT